MINLVFDDVGMMRTMAACPDTVIRSSDHVMDYGRFPIPYVFRLISESSYIARTSDAPVKAFSLDDRPDRYAYDIATAVDPVYWMGKRGNQWGFRNLFEIVPHCVMEDARNGRALLIVDCLMEGFQTDELYQFWHMSCEKYSIPPRSILHLTGNLHEKHGYDEWARNNAIEDKITVVGYCYFEHLTRKWAQLSSSDGLTWADHVEKKHKHQLKIKTFNCLNRRRKFHREYLMLNLIEAGLHRHGLISHDTIGHRIDTDQPVDWEKLGIKKETLAASKKILPLTVDGPDFSIEKAEALTNDVFLNSWVTVVTETHAFDEPHHVFISEKTVKPINSLHPFMVLGHRGTLKELHKMGYKTFDGLIDESYDDKPFFDRIRIIMKNLARIQVIRDKMGWFEQTRDICEHNKRIFLNNNFLETQAYADILAAYNNLSG